MNIPYVSIIIPVYNEEAELSRCLESVLRQTFSDLEVIVINDASTDNSGSIIDTFSRSDDRIISLKNQNNLGQGACRNTGIEQSKGSYIFFLDSDDYLPDNSIEKLSEIAVKHKSDIIIGKTSADIDIDSMYVSGDLFNITIRDHAQLLYNHSVWNKLIKKEFITEHKLAFDSSVHAEDILFALKCNLLAGSISITNQVTYYYHWNRQVENRNKQKIIDARKHSQTALDIVLKLGDPLLIREMYRKTARNCYASMVRANSVFDDNDIIEHLEWWQQVLEEIPENVISDLPAHQRVFCSLIIGKQHGDAFLYWKERQKPANIISRYFHRLLTRIKTGQNSG